MPGGVSEAYTEVFDLGLTGSIEAVLPTQYKISALISNTYATIIPYPRCILGKQASSLRTQQQHAQAVHLPTDPEVGAL